MPRMLSKFLRFLPKRVSLHQASRNFRNTCTISACRPCLLQTLKQVGSDCDLRLFPAPLLHGQLRASSRDSPQTPSLQFQRVHTASSAQSSIENEGRFDSFDPGSEACQAWDGDPLDETLYLEEEDSSPISTTKAVIHCFWDLDNKPADGREQAAVLPARIRAALLPYGKLATMNAFGNIHCFNYVPLRERIRRKEVQQIRKIVTDAVHTCMICGNKFKTLDKLTKHFTSVHEREMKKRKNRSQNKGGKGRRQAATYFADEAKLSRYYDMHDSVLTPRKGYGLKHRLRREEVEVIRTTNEPQAADIALDNAVSHMLSQETKPDGGNSDRALAVCIISDDRGFRATLDRCKRAGCHTIAICQETGRFGLSADTHLNWDMVKDGLFN